jgi:2-polyprenyl-6-methoxyphenol hydroxylase-like FAD-dependent oxidoreductase
MMQIENPDVLIVGAGPSGLMMACQLARFGIRFRIIDKKNRSSPSSGALILHARSLELFQQMGIAEEAVRQGIFLRNLNLFFGRKNFRIGLDKLGEGLSDFPSVLMLEQFNTEKLLTDFLEKAGQRVEKNTELLDFRQNGHGVTAFLKCPGGQKEKIHAAYLVAADGSHSRIRKKLAIAFIGKTRQIPLAISDCQADADMARETVCFCFQNRFSAGCFPLPGGRWRIDTAFFKMKQTNPTFDMLKENFRKNKKLPQPAEHADWFSVFLSHQRVAEKFRDGRCFLIGDAAHVFSPVGAQGMNCGLQDAHNLAWKLAFVIGKKVEAALLTSYETERRPVAVRIAKATGWFSRLAASENIIFRILRLNLLPVFLRLFLPLLSNRNTGNFIFRRISGIGIRYRKSMLAAGNDCGYFKCGCLLPWSFYDEMDLGKKFSGTVFSLFVFAEEKEAGAIIHIARQFSEILNLKRISVPPEAKRTDLRVKIKNKGWLLVRPDGYVACCSAETNGAALEKYLQQLLISEK